MKILLDNWVNLILIHFYTPLQILYLLLAFLFWIYHLKWLLVPHQHVQAHRLDSMIWFAHIYRSIRCRWALPYMIVSINFNLLLGQLLILALCHQTNSSLSRVIIFQHCIQSMQRHLVKQDYYSKQIVTPPASIIYY